MVTVDRFWHRSFERVWPKDLGRSDVIRTCLSPLIGISTNHWHMSPRICTVKIVCMYFSTAEWFEPTRTYIDRSDV